MKKKKERKLITHSPDAPQKMWVYRERDTESDVFGDIFEHRDRCLLPVLAPAKNGRYEGGRSHPLRQGKEREQKTPAEGVKRKCNFPLG